MGGPYTQEFIESVRQAGDIARLVGEYVPLKRAGTRLKGLCPFHEEKTPSFSVDPERQLFYCFGCQTGGDVFKFLMLYERVKFGEAIEILAKSCGLPLPMSQPSQPDGPRERVLKMNRVAAEFFRETLKTESLGASCRSYLTKRRLTDETVERLGIGFARPAWDALLTHLRQKRFTEKEMQLSGLVVPRKSGSGQYDRFRERVIFPIHDIGGRTVAFGGRSLGQDEPKYINSPETPAYTKGDHLYGLDLARDAIRKADSVIVVEGYLDLAALVQAGFGNVVASLGTAFTPAQARLLARHTEKVFFSYDGDAAGAKAMLRSFDLLLEKGFEVRVVELPDGKDPDDFIRDEGADGYGKQLREAPEYIEYLVRQQAVGHDLNTIDQQVAAVNAVLPQIAKLTNSIKRGMWASRLAESLGIEEGLVMQELKAVVRDARPTMRSKPATTVGKIAAAEARLVSLLIGDATERKRLLEELDRTDLAGTSIRNIVDTILRMEKDGCDVSFPLVLEELKEETERALLNVIAFRDEPDEGPTIEDCLWAFKRKRLAHEGRKVLRQIGETQRRGEDISPTDPNDIDQQLERLQELARQRDALT